MRQYTVSYAYIGDLNATVHQGARILSLRSASETEALAVLKQQLNGHWRSYGPKVEVVILSVKPL